MTTDQVLDELMAKLNLSALEADDDGLFTFHIDGALTVFMRLAPADEHVMFFAGIGTIAPEEAGAVCPALLESNYFWQGTGGFTLSLIPATLNVLLTAREKLSTMSEGDGFELFDRFIAAAEVWKAKLPSMATQSPVSELHEDLERVDEGESEIIDTSRFA